MFDLKDLEEYQQKLNKKVLSYGISYLDDGFGGLLCNDLVILSAHSGLGKSELCSIVACANAMDNKNVYYFALEAFKYELDYRIIFRIAMQKYYDDNPKIKYSELTFTEYLKMNIPEHLQNYFEDAKQTLRVLRKNLHIKYIDDDYTIGDFEKDLLKIDLQADCIIIDHLHYFTLGDEFNENTEITNIVKRLRYLTKVLNIPIILVSHLKKNNTIYKRLCPSIDDLHGTSNIFKIAARVAFIAPDNSLDVQNENDNLTIFRIVKNRYDGNTTKYIGLCNYDSRVNQYSKKYMLGKLSIDDTKYEVLKSKIPRWAVNRKI